MICRILVAHDENLILSYTLNQNNLPYIAILDNPTPEVKRLTSNAIATYETEYQDEHIYNWQNILDLIKRAALYAKHCGYSWVIRTDADECWAGVESVIKIAEDLGYNIVNFRIKQFEPLIEHVEKFNINDQKQTDETSTIHLEPDGNYYHRAWKLDTDKFNLGGGGHLILRNGNKVYESEYHFNHYPAIDKESLHKKAERKYNETEKKKGWHIQYNGLLK